MSAKEIAGELIALAAKGDADGMARLMTDDVAVHLAGRSQLAGTATGTDGFFSFFGRLQQLCDRTFKPSVHAITDEGEHAAALLEISATRNGATRTWNQVNVYHVRDGKISEVWLLPEDLYAFDEFWGTD